MARHDGEESIRRMAETANKWWPMGLLAIGVVAAIGCGLLYTLVK